MAPKVHVHLRDRNECDDEQNRKDRHKREQPGDGTARRELLLGSCQAHADARQRDEEKIDVQVLLVVEVECDRVQEEDTQILRQRIERHKPEGIKCCHEARASLSHELQNAARSRVF